MKESDRIEITTVTEDLDITKVIVTIKTTKIEDAGTYEIIAENREGKSVTSLILNVTGKKLRSYINSILLIFFCLWFNHEFLIFYNFLSIFQISRKTKET